MSYFGRIASRASGGQGPSTLAQPVVRSASPLVEFDQRLHLTSDTGEPAFDMTQAPIHGAGGSSDIEGPAPDAAPRASASLEPRAGPRLRAFGAPQHAARVDSFSYPAGDERAPDVDSRRQERARSDGTSELGAASIEVLSSEGQPSRELTAETARVTPQTSARYSISRTEAGRETITTALVPTDLVTARADATETTASTPFATKVRPSPEPAKLEPATRSNRTDPNSVLGEALAKVSAWMKRPAPIAPSTPGRAETAEHMAVEPFGTPSLPKLVIGQIDIEVITPKAPPQPATRRPRAPQAVAAPRPAYSSVAKQSFGSRQR